MDYQTPSLRELPSLHNGCLGDRRRVDPAPGGVATHPGRHPLPDTIAQLEKVPTLCDAPAEELVPAAYACGSEREGLQEVI